ncbi:MAG: radical SAM protein, partial [Elusimicrobiota bacterium]|nr:radical SAM protein [Elusimicrobiota bacterium]
RGVCKSGLEVKISSVGPHFGEERELVGRNGSGTIFFTNCNLGCIYCQNYDISHLGYGKEVTIEELAEAMLHLQSLGCHNVNLVTPTHFVPQIVAAISLACSHGLRLPIVYNCSGYENVDVIKLLDGIIDIYMPDIKYSDELAAKKYSNAPDYFERCKEAVREMHRQVGDLQIIDDIAYRGLLVRHLILPNNLAGSEEVFRFLSEEISKDTYVNIMDQYRPMYKASDFVELNRRPTYSEYKNAIELAEKSGLHRGF